MKVHFLFPGIEARGFIFGPPIALAIGAKFVPLRKPRKLPGTFNLAILVFYVPLKRALLFISILPKELCMFKRSIFLLIGCWFLAMLFD